MKFALIPLLLLFPVLSGFAQESPCRAYFQVLREDGRTQGSFSEGMTPSQKKWWESKGQKKYPGLCLAGSVSAPAKPHYLVIWSGAGSGEYDKPLDKDPAGQRSASIDSSQAYGQSAATIETTVPTAWIYKRRWNWAPAWIVSFEYDGTVQVPPVYVPTHAYFWSPSAGQKVLDDTLKFLTTKG